MKGTLSSGGAPLAGASVTLLRCKPSGASCKKVGTAKTSGSGKVTFTTKVKKTSLYELVFTGGPGVFGCTATAKVKAVKPHH